MQKRRVILIRQARLAFRFAAYRCAASRTPETVLGIRFRLYHPNRPPAFFPAPSLCLAKYSLCSGNSEYRVARRTKELGSVAEGKEEPTWNLGQRSFTSYAAVAKPVSICSCGKAVHFDINKPALLWYGQKSCGGNIGSVVSSMSQKCASTVDQHIVLSRADSAIIAVNDEDSRSAALYRFHSSVGPISGSGPLAQFSMVSSTLDAHHFAQSITILSLRASSAAKTIAWLLITSSNVHPIYSR